MDNLPSVVSKGGAMTVPKLVAIILAIVVLIILVFGAGHLNPLYQRVGTMFDNVLMFFGLGGGDALGECSYIPLEDYGSDGISFLERVGVPPEEYKSTFFQICDNGLCGVDFASGKDYRIVGGRFESRGKDPELGDDKNIAWSLREKEMNHILRDGVLTTYFLAAPSLSMAMFDIKLDTQLPSSAVGYILDNGDIEITVSNTGLDDLENYGYVGGELRKKDGGDALFSLGGNGIYYIFKEDVITQYLLEDSSFNKVNFDIKFDTFTSSEPTGLIYDSGEISIVGDSSTLKDLENYVYSNGEFKRKPVDSSGNKLEEENWVSQSKYLFHLRSTSQTKKEWDLYSGFLNLAEEKLGEEWLKKFYDDMYTDRFVLYGDGSGPGGEVYMYWQNGFWEGTNSKWLLYSGYDDKKAINDFALEVSGKEEGQSWADYIFGLEFTNSQDDVYFRTEKDYRRNKDPEYDTSLASPDYPSLTDSPAKQYKAASKSGRELTEYDWQPIYEIVGKAGGNYELDTVGEITTLREEFLKRKKKFLEDSYPSEENLTKFKEAVAGEKIKTAFGEYVIDVEWDFSTSAGHYPLVKLISEEETVELKFEHQTKFISPYDFVNNGEYLRDYPLMIEYPRGLTNRYYNEEDYKLIEESFNKSYRLNLIEDFIWEQCR